MDVTRQAGLGDGVLLEKSWCEHVLFLPGFSGPFLGVLQKIFQIKTQL